MSRTRAALRHTLRVFFGDSARFELFALVVLLFCAGAAWVFVEIADEVLEGEVRAWDEWILLAMRTPGDANDPIGAQWLEELMRDVTALGGVAILAGLTLLVAGLLFLDGQRTISLLIVLAVGGGVAMSFLLKATFERPRPNLVPHATYVATTSFPSGHAMAAAVAYLTLGGLLARTFARRKLKVFVLAAAFVVAALIGVSRVYLGVHWPSDVLAGWAAGAFWASLCWFLAWRLQVFGRAEPEREP